MGEIILTYDNIVNKTIYAVLSSYEGYSILKGSIQASAESSIIGAKDNMVKHGMDPLEAMVHMQDLVIAYGHRNDKDWTFHIDNSCLVSEYEGQF